MNLAWRGERFDELGVRRLYALLQLRSEVFVLEQHCVFLDPDGLDEDALHVSAWEGDAPMAYARLLAPGIKAASPVVSRVITAPAARGSGVGHELMAHAVALCTSTWPQQGITLFAQAHLRGFYERHGFHAVGDVFIEDDIPHQRMDKEASP